MSISPTSTGELSRSERRDGGSSPFLRCASADLPACCRFQSRSAEAQSSSARFSTCRTRTTRALRSRGCGQRLSPYWRYPVSRDRQRPSSPTRSERSWIPTSRRSGPSRGRSETCSSSPITAMCSHSIMYRVFRVAFRYALSANDRWRFRNASALHRPRRDAVRCRPIILNGIENVINRRRARRAAEVLTRTRSR
jgi:hypothetical protein